MPRTKRRAWRGSRDGMTWEERVQLLRERRQLSRLPPSTTEIDDAMQDTNHEDEIASDDGGIPLDLRSDAIMASEDDTIDAMNIEKYRQNATVSFNHSQPLWKRPPGRPLNVKIMKGNPDLAIPCKYQQYCSSIQNYWKCDFEEWIPEHLRSRTPYSLAMLYTLRRLASNSKGHCEIAQTAMSRTWQERIDQMDGSSQDAQRSFVAAPPYFDQPHCEEIVQENIFGLMIIDVVNALQSLVANKYPDLPDPKQMRQAQEDAKAIMHGGRESKKARSVRLRPEKIAKKQAKREKILARVRSQQAKREAKLLKNFIHDAQSEMQRISNRDIFSATAIPSKSLNRRKKKLAALLQQVVLSNHAEPHLQGSAQQQQQDQSTAAAGSKLLAHDNENDETMARMLDEIKVVKRSRRARKESHRRLMEGGLIRGREKALMPSEKTDFNTLSALPPALSTLTSEQLTEMSKLSLHDQTG